MSEITPSEAYDFVVDAIRIKHIPYLAGPPGVGKSDIMQKVADDFNLEMVDERLSQKLPEDLTGLPTLRDDKKKASYIEFDTFPMEGDEVPAGRDGWLLFLDELSSCSEEVLAAIYSLLLGRRVGGKNIHQRVVIVSAGNRETDSAIARALPDTIKTRVLIAEVKVSSKDWIDWAAASSKKNQGVINFIARHPDQLYSTQDPNDRKELETFPTPRGWGVVFDVVNMHEKNAKASLKIPLDSAGLPIPNADAIMSTPLEERSMRLIRSAVGTFAATAFMEHYNDAMSIPTVTDISQSPSSTTIPGTLAGKAKVTTDLVKFFSETPETTRSNIIQYMNRMPAENKAVFVEELSNTLRDTPSDRKLIEDIKKRLAVPDIQMPPIPDASTLPVTNGGSPGVPGVGTSVSSSGGNTPMPVKKENLQDLLASLTNGESINIASLSAEMQEQLKNALKP